MMAVNMESEGYFGALMQRLKEALGLTSDTALADALGMKQSAFANRKKAGSVPFQNVIRLALDRDLDMDWLFEDVGRAAELGEASATAIEQLAGELYVSERPPKQIATRTRKRVEAQEGRFSEFELVEQVGILGSAGAGADNVIVEPKGALAFRRDWLQTKGVAAKELIVADIVGDSMERTLFHTDTVLFRQQHEMTADDIYLFCLDGRLFVKRLSYKPGGAIEVISDNREKYPASEITEREAAAQRFEIKGRFFWRGGDRLQ
jgi:phage repressor protein C with HTH and peptisase S24 domain